MSGFLLDTNVVSEMVKPQPSPAVLEWLNATEESLLHLSILTVGELRRGITRLRPGRRRISLESWLITTFRSDSVNEFCPLTWRLPTDGEELSVAKLRADRHCR